MANFNSGKAAATVTLNPNSLNQTYDGTPKLVTATTNPPGLTISLTYNGSFVPPINAGLYNVVVTVIDPNYQGTTSGTLNLAKATPDLFWSVPAPVIYGTPLTGTQLNATAKSPGGRN